MTKNIFYFLLVACCFISGCRKEKTVVFSGRLLFTQKHPTPVAHRKIELFQPGSPSAIGLNSGSTSAQAVSVTDGSGFYQVRFTTGRTSFIIFSGSNSSNLYMRSTDTSFPSFTRRNIPVAGHETVSPQYIGKLIDTAVIKVSVITALTSSDTIGLRATSLSGRLNKEYTGITAAAGTVVVIDTIFNMLFTDFDHLDSSFRNDLHAGRQTTTSSGNKFINSTVGIIPFQFPAGDEGLREITFYYKK